MSVNVPGDFTAQDYPRPAVTEAHFAPVPVDNVPDSVASTISGLVTDFNALLAVLKAGGLMEDDA